MAKQNASPYQGPYGEPIGPGNMPRDGMSPGLMQAGYVSGQAPKAGTDLIQMGYLDGSNCDTCAPGQGRSAGPGAGPKGGQVKPAHYEKPAPLPFYNHKDGIVPVPAGVVPGAVPAVGALPFQMPRQPINMRTSIYYASPDGMKITWYGPNGWNDQALITPARYNYLQGGVYRLRLSSIPNRLEKVYYPTLEVIPTQEATATYLAHSSVPITFTDEDFEQVDSNNFLVKVIYLPNPANQDLAAVAGPNELVSTRLEPGIDPVVEAQRRGTLLAIVRLGNIDLNTPNSPAMDAPNPYMMQRMLPPGMAPIGPTDRPDVKPIPIPLPKGVAPPEDPKRPTNLPILDKNGKPILEIKDTMSERPAQDPRVIPVNRGERPAGTVPLSRTIQIDEDGAVDDAKPTPPVKKRPPSLQ